MNKKEVTKIINAYESCFYIFLIGNHIFNDKEHRVNEIFTYAKFSEYQRDNAYNGWKKSVMLRYTDMLGQLIRLLSKDIYDELEKIREPIYYKAKEDFKNMTLEDKIYYIELLSWSLHFSKDEWQEIFSLVHHANCPKLLSKFKDVE